MAIRTKLVLILLVFIIIPMMLGVAVLFHYMQGVVREVRILQLENIANLEKERVDAFFAERKGNVELFQALVIVKDSLPVFLKYSNEKNSPSYISAQKRLDERLDAVRTTYGYSDAMLVDPRGSIILVANETHRAGQLGKPLSSIDARAFDGGRKGIYFGDIYKSGNVFGMLCTAPLYGRTGEFIGEVAFEIDAGRVFELVHEATGLGTTGETYIGIPRGDEVMFINPYHPERNKTIKVKDLSDRRIATPMQNALRDKNGSGESVDYLGHEVLAAWRHVPSTGWGLVAKIDTSEAFTPVVRLKRLAFAAELLIVFFCGAAAFLLSRSIVKPIMNLREGMEKVGSGNLDYKVGTEAKDEIGQLSREFDSMAGNLKLVTSSRDDLNREVAERRQAEAAGAESAKRYRMLFDAIDEGFCIVEMLFDENEKPIDYRFLEVNPSFEKQTGLVDAQGKRMRELAPDHEEHWFEIYGKIALTGEPARFQNRAAQLHRWYDVYAFRFGQPEERQVAILFNDVTERMQNEEALRLAGAYNRSLLEASLDPLVTIGPDGKITDVNTSSEMVTGRTRNELVGTDFSDYFTEPEEARTGYQQVFREGYVIDYPLEVRHRDGRVTPVLYNASVYRDEIGNVIGVFAAARDITERKRNEEVLRASVRLSEYGLNHSLDELLTRALDEAEAQTGSRIGFFHFVEADGKTLQLQTWSTNTLQNMCTAEGKGQHYPVDKAGVWVEAIAQRSPVVHNDYASLPNRKGLPPGHAPVIRELVVPILRGGQVMGVLGVGNKPGEYVAQDIDTVARLASLAWDIILAKRAEDEVRRLNLDLELRVVERTAKLAETNKELEAFSYSVSHDLRAPLRHIQGFVELLAKNAQASLDEKSRRHLATISSSATRMGELIDDLLMFSRMGRAEMHMATVDLGRLAETLINEMRPETEGRDIEWKIDTMPPAYCDPSMMRLVMVNLISNALKFTKHRPHAVIEIGGMSEEKGETTFFIRDNGAGFDMQYVDKLFGVFQRLHRIEEFEGTGIGLANVRRIISRHGGRTWAEGAPDKGATIYFTLPDREAEEEQNERA